VVRLNLWQAAQRLEDDLTLLKMDLLTGLAARIYPSGYWGQGRRSAEGKARAYLTFDDGPCPQTTPRLLETLSGQEVKATFFLIGVNANRYPHLVEQIAAAGHTIGNHSYNHLPLPLLPKSIVIDEIDRTSAAIYAGSGVSPSIFRPPFGLMDQRIAVVLAERQIVPVYWGAVPEDCLGPGAETVARRVMRRLRDGTLVVLHEHGGIAKQTAAAAKQIICKARDAGLEFEPLPARPIGF